MSAHGIMAPYPLVLMSAHKKLFDGGPPENQKLFAEIPQKIRPLGREHIIHIIHIIQSRIFNLINRRWSLQNKQENFEINLRIIDRGRVFNPINRRCGLCTKEKFYIIFQPEGATLNQRSELFSTCRHRLRKLLANTQQRISFWYRIFPLNHYFSHFQLSLKIVVFCHMKQFVRPMCNKS